MSVLVAVAGIALLAGCAQDHKPNVIEHPELAVVQLAAQSATAPSAATGFGFFVSEDGLIVTCLHALANNSYTIAVLSNGQNVRADLIEEDRDADVAILQVHGGNFPYLKLHDDDFPPGLHVRIVTNKGVIHGIFDQWESLGKEMNISARDATLDLGAPVLADNGEVIGVLRLSPHGNDRECLATPIWHIQKMMPRLGGQH